MMRAFVRLTTGVELGFAALTLFIGFGFAALVSVGMEGTPRLLVAGFIVVAAVGLLTYNALGIWRRYQRLIHGRCGHSVCHGAVSGRDGLPEHLVECSNCRRVWPRLTGMQIEAPA